MAVERRDIIKRQWPGNAVSNCKCICHFTAAGENERALGQITLFHLLDDLPVQRGLRITHAGLEFHAIEERSGSILARHAHDWKKRFDVMPYVDIRSNPVQR